METSDSDVRQPKSTFDAPHLTHLAVCASSTRRRRAQELPSKRICFFDHLTPSCEDEYAVPEYSNVACTGRLADLDFIAVHRCILFRFVFIFLKRPPKSPQSPNTTISSFIFRRVYAASMRHGWKAQRDTQQQRDIQYKAKDRRKVEIRSMDWELISEQVLRHVEECLPRPPSSTAVNLDSSETPPGSYPSSVHADPARPVESQTINRSHR